MKLSRFYNKTSFRFLPIINVFGPPPCSTAFTLYSSRLVGRRYFKSKDSWEQSRETLIFFLPLFLIWRQLVRCRRQEKEGRETVMAPATPAAVAAQDNKKLPPPSPVRSILAGSLAGAIEICANFDPLPPLPLPSLVPPPLHRQKP